MQPPNANPQLLPNGFSYQSKVLSAQKSLDLFYYLQQNLNWQQPNITVFGKTGPIPRLQCFISEENLEYGYSGHKLDLEPWPDVLLAMRTRLENHLQQPFNSILVNYYRDGHDCMGWHSDDEAELGPEPTIACVSLGAERLFTERTRRRGGGARQDPQPAELGVDAQLLRQPALADARRPAAGKRRRDRGLPRREEIQTHKDA